MGSCVMTDVEMRRGRKRIGWTDDLLGNVRAASASLKDLSDEDIVRVVRTERERKDAAPEVTLPVKGRTRRH